jgi:hypothetical protein
MRALIFQYCNMKKNHAVIFFLFFLYLSAQAQYIHFNNVYTSIDGASSQSIMFDMSDCYLTFGSTLLTIGFEYRKNDDFGVSLENQIIETTPYQPGNFLLTPSGFITSAVTQDNACSPVTQTAGCQLLNEQFEQIWVHQFPEWSVCDSVTNSNVAYDLMNDSSFVMLSYFAHKNGQNFEPDSMGWRITRINHYNGQAYESYRYVTPYFAFSPKQIIFSEGYYFVSGYYIPFQGTTSNPSDRQMVVYKISAEGEIVGEMSLGNPDVCYETHIYMEEMDNGKIAIAYEECIEMHESATSPWPFRHSTPHFSILDPLTFELVNDYEYFLPEMDLWQTGIYPAVVIEDAQNNFLLVQDYYTYADDPPSPQSDPNVHYNIFTKFAPDGEIIWQNQYFSPASGGSLYVEDMINDIIQTPDGGYMCTGTAFDNSNQLHWLLKIDNCGYEQPSGCPAVVSTDDEETKISSDIQLWPNPCHNILKAVLPVDAVSMRLYDQTGRVVLEEKVYYPNQEWNVSALERGVYVLEVVRENSLTASIKIVKN